MLSYLVDENYAIIFFLMLIATCVQHGVLCIQKNTHKLSIDVPNVGYPFGWNGDYIKKEKDDNFFNQYTNFKWFYSKQCVIKWLQQW